MLKYVLLLVSFISLFAVKSQNTNSELDKIFYKTVDGDKIHGAVIHIFNTNNSFNYLQSAGNLDVGSSYFIASTSKLYATAIIMKLIDEGKISLKDNLSKFFSKEEIMGIHTYKGVDYSGKINIEQLLSHTSGLPDYFQDKNISTDKKIFKELIKGNDTNWSFEEVLEMCRSMKPKFIPGNTKAYYSDANYQILGEIIQRVTQLNLEEAIERYIFQKIDANSTYIYKDENDSTPALMYYKKEILNIPKAMSSMDLDGGVVSNVKDQSIFIKSFFEGVLFDSNHLKINTSYFNKIMFPLAYGIGIMRFSLPAAMSLGKKMPTLIGHSGHSGAFAWYCPEKDLYITGTVNQINNPNLSYQLIIKLLQTID